MADALSSLTPYNYSFNNPVLFNDPLGDYPTGNSSNIDTEQRKEQDQARTQGQSSEFFARNSGGGGGILDKIKNWLWSMVSPPSSPEEGYEQAKAHAVTGKIKEGLNTIKEGQDVVMEAFFPGGFLITGMNDTAHGDFSGEEFAQNVGYEAVFGLMGPFKGAAKGVVKETVEQVGKNFNKISDTLLKKSGIDAHQLKRDFLGNKAKISQYDLYKDKQTNEILILQKGGKGNPIRTNEFLEKL